MIDIRQSLQYAKYLSSIGWKVERINETNYFIKKFPLIGSVIKIQRPEQLDIETARQLGIKYRAFQIIVEPKNEYQVSNIQTLGFRLSRNPYLPTKTLLLDLTKPKDLLLKEMKKDARNAIEKNKIIVKSCKNLEEFRNVWKKATGWTRYIPPLSHLLALEKSFKKNCLFLLTEDKSSGAIFLIGDKIAYYWQAFTNKEGRKKLAQYKVVWEGILWAKKMSTEVFDFEGIYDERFPNKSWLGFTHFKKSFGGYEKEYPGCFVQNKYLITW